MTWVGDPRVRRWAAATVSLLSVSLLLGGCGGSADEAVTDNPAGVEISAPPESRYHGAELPDPYTMPDVTLTATDEQDFNLRDDNASRVTIVFFGYTNCPDVCPLIMSDLTAALARVPDDVRDETAMLFITTDPSRDTPSVLREYLDRYDPEYEGLTGDLADIVTAAEAMGVAIEGKQKLPSGGYEVGHGTQVIGFRGDQAPVVWTSGTSVDDFAAGITALAQS